MYMLPTYTYTHPQLLLTIQCGYALFFPWFWTAEVTVGFWLRVVHPCGKYLPLFFWPTMIFHYGFCYCCVSKMVYILLKPLLLDHCQPSNHHLRLSYLPWLKTIETAMNYENCMTITNHQPNHQPSTIMNQCHELKIWLWATLVPCWRSPKIDKSFSICLDVDLPICWLVNIYVNIDPRPFTIMSQCWTIKDTFSLWLRWN